MFDINTQNKAILNHLMSGKEISPQVAMTEFGCLRLGARIYDLREQGYPIMTTMRVAKNRFGRKVQYASYKLEQADLNLDA